MPLTSCQANGAKISGMNPGFGGFRPPWGSGGAALAGNPAASVVAPAHGHCHRAQPVRDSQGLAHVKNLATKMSISTSPFV